MTEGLRGWLEESSQVLLFPWEEWEEEEEEAEVYQVDASNTDIVEDPTADQDDAEDCQSGKGGRRDGAVSLSWSNGDTFSGSYWEGRRSGWGCVTCPRRGMASLTGEWVAGSLEGRGTVAGRDASKLEGRWRRGRLHGLARRWGGSASRRP